MSIGVLGAVYISEKALLLWQMFTIMRLFLVSNIHIVL